MGEVGAGSDRFRLPATRFDFCAPVPAIGEIAAAHFIAIGGSGMSGIARLFLDAGVSVSGSDANESVAVAELREAGARVAIGHDATNLPSRAGSDVHDRDESGQESGPARGGRTVVVVSSAIREDNPELLEARRRGLTVLHRAQGLAALLPGRVAVAVAGANGKTTTSAMLTVALHEAGTDPGFVIGSPIGGWGRSAALGSGTGFVVEADESDGSFLSYRPEVAVVTNIRPDHLDHYGDIETIEEAFRAFAATIRPGGLLVVCQDDPRAAALGRWFAGRGGRVLRYGISVEADVRVTEIDVLPDGRGAVAQVVDDTQQAASSVTLSIPFPGVHNLANATAAYTAAVHGLGAAPARVLAGLATFSGTARRFEDVGSAAGVRVVDDYAHNPDKVAAVVAAGRSVVSGDGRLIAVFQPHLFSRTRDFAAEFATALSGADRVVLLDVFAAREDPIAGVDGALVRDRLAELWGESRDADLRYVPVRDEVPAVVAALAGAGDLVLTIGAGDVTALGPQILTAVSGTGTSQDHPSGAGPEPPPPVEPTPPPQPTVPAEED